LSLASEESDAKGTVFRSASPFNAARVSVSP
jgi:hypothetical protein